MSIQIKSHNPNINQPKVIKVENDSIIFKNKRYDINVHFVDSGDLILSKFKNLGVEVFSKEMLLLHFSPFESLNSIFKAFTVIDDSFDEVFYYNMRISDLTFNNLVLIPSNPNMPIDIEKIKEAAMSKMGYYDITHGTKILYKSDIIDLSKVDYVKAAFKFLDSIILESAPDISSPGTKVVNTFLN